MTTGTRPARLLYNEDGVTLDEIVYGPIHVEQLDEHVYWMQVGESHFHFRAEPYIVKDDDGGPTVRVRIRFTLDDEGAGDFPLAQRHKTEAEILAMKPLRPTEAPDTESWYVTLRVAAAESGEREP